MAIKVVKSEEEPVYPKLRIRGDPLISIILALIVAILMILVIPNVSNSLIYFRIINTLNIPLAVSIGLLVYFVRTRSYGELSINPDEKLLYFEFINTRGKKYEFEISFEQISRFDVTLDTSRFPDLDLEQAQNKLWKTKFEFIITAPQPLNLTLVTPKEFPHQLFKDDKMEVSLFTEKDLYVEVYGSIPGYQNFLYQLISYEIIVSNNINKEVDIVLRRNLDMFKPTEKYL